ncbi:MAG: sugar ABC transporter permease [Spirochaetales bacterium]|nr:sugar ABC transporter permease [Spirochaetales bacterium]
MKKLPYKLRTGFHRDKELLLMLLPVVVYFIVFHYIPMYGATIAFKNYTPAKGFTGSPWVGFVHFVRFFNSVFFSRVVINTFAISALSLLFGFPAPIILALLLNEVKLRWFKNSVQTITYLPHFISLVVIIGLLREFTLTDGVVNDMLSFFGVQRRPLLQFPEYFRTLFVVSEVWQTIGWNSIIYLAALSGVDPELYEAAKIDGANRWKQTIHITLPSIQSTIMILLILRMGRLFTVGFEKIILMYSPSTYSVADVISTLVYRTGLLEMNFSYSTAVGLFNSLINFLMLLLANKLSKRFSETSLW